MSKRGVISLSIVLFIVVLIGVLFGTVFCLRSQTVVISGESTISASKSEIVSTAGLKKGQSIFLLDKDEAIKRVEQKYPYVKVIQITTTSLTKIQIQVRARHEMYYAEFNEKYYVMDEDLKVLNIIQSTEEEENNEPTNLIKISSDKLNINKSTSICAFVGSDYLQNVTRNLYISMITTVTKTEGDGEDTKEVYFSRADMCDMLQDVKFEEYKTYNKIIVTTKYGVKLDIENPTKNLENKINICFSTIKQFLSSSDPLMVSRAQEGTIKIYYNSENLQVCVYIPQESPLGE